MTVRWDLHKRGKPHMTACIIEKIAKQRKNHTSAVDFDLGFINRIVEKMWQQQFSNSKQRSWPPTEVARVFMIIFDGFPKVLKIALNVLGESVFLTHVMEQNHRRMVRGKIGVRNEKQAKLGTFFA